MVLSVPIGKEENSIWETLICKVKAKLKLCSMHDISIDGKVQITKFIGLATVSYALKMKIINQDHVKELRKVLWHFLWSGKSYSVNNEICILPKHAGGLGMIDLSILIKQKLQKSRSWCNKNTRHVESSYILQPPRYLLLFVNRFRYISNDITKDRCPIPMDTTVRLGPLNLSYRLL